MKITMSANHLARYRQIALLLWKYGRSDLVQQMGIDDTLAGDAAASESTADASPAQLADDLEAMGPTYVKVGQVLASRPDLLPEPYLKALARLQDKVKPFSYAEVEEIVTTELGVRISKAFSSFDPEPIAAASLGQVHSAALARRAAGGGQGAAAGHRRADRRGLRGARADRRIFRRAHRPRPPLPLSGDAGGVAHHHPAGAELRARSAEPRHGRRKISRNSS